jgi:hypothetical protein
MTDNPKVETESKVTRRTNIRFRFDLYEWMKKVAKTDKDYKGSLSAVANHCVEMVKDKVER